MDDSNVTLPEEKIRNPKKIEKYIKKATKEKKTFLRKDKESIGLISIKPHNQKTKLTFKGVPASAGKAKGKAVIIKNKDSLEKIKEGKISVLRGSTPQITPYITKADGLIGERNSILCHLGVISREYRIPCILSVKNATEIIKNGDLIKLNSKKNLVEVIR